MGYFNCRRSDDDDDDDEEEELTVSGATFAVFRDRFCKPPPVFLSTLYLLAVVFLSDVELALTDPVVESFLFADDADDCDVDAFFIQNPFS